VLVVASGEAGELCWPVKAGGVPRDGFIDGEAEEDTDGLVNLDSVGREEVGKLVDVDRVGEEADAGDAVIEFRIVNPTRLGILTSELKAKNKIKQYFASDKIVDLIGVEQTETHEGFSWS